VIREVDFALQVGEALFIERHALLEGTGVLFRLREARLIGFSEGLKCLKKSGLSVVNRLLQIVECVLHFGPDHSALFGHFRPDDSAQFGHFRPDCRELICHLGSQAIHLSSQIFDVALRHGRVAVNAHASSY
jgi:hypothetical protein